MHVKKRVSVLKGYFSVLIARIMKDRMTMMAGSLTYTTLLSLVPFAAVVFYLLSAFPMFSDVSVKFKAFLFENLVPTAGDVIQGYIEQFIGNLNQMTAIGAIGLVVTSLLVIDSINSALNHIWQTKRRRPFFYNLAIYWTILSLGPILIGVSIVVSSYLFSLKVFSESGGGQLSWLLRMLPFAFSCLSFWLLYCVVPTEKVRVLDAAIGAVFAALLFELGKKAFAFYISSFPTYQLIYGVLATIPILFVWIYFSWCIVLLGAEIAASLSTFRRLYYRCQNQHSAEDHCEITTDETESVHPQAEFDLQSREIAETEKDEQK